MGLMKSIHSGLGYEKTFDKGFSIKTEAYYQYLYEVPVTVSPSAFSTINMGSGFARLPNKNCKLLGSKKKKTGAHEGPNGIN